MARQGLMDDSGYDFFDVSDCANYESCREDAYNDGYEKGRADAIDEFEEKILEMLPNEIDAKVHNGSLCLDICALAIQLKENSNGEKQF